jgi:hypothetical protein
MYIMLKKAEDDELLLFIILKISDLSPENIYLLSKGLPNKKYIAIIPTHQDMDEDSEFQSFYDGFEKYCFSLYRHK